MCTPSLELRIEPLALSVYLLGERPATELHFQACSLPFSKDFSTHALLWEVYDCVGTPTVCLRAALGLGGFWSSAIRGIPLRLTT